MSNTLRHAHAGRFREIEHPLAYRVLGKQEAINEGLFDLEDERAEAQIAYEIDLTESYEAPCWPEYEPIDWSDTQAEVDLWGGDEPVAEWEWMLLTGQDDHDDYLAYVDEHKATRPVEDDVEDDDDLDEQPHWLAGDVNEVFPHGGYVIEGRPKMTSVRASGYVRVYELAREIGLNTTHLIEALRSHGEYVNSGFAYVALPVCDQVREVAPYLVQHYGQRIPTPGDAWHSLTTLRSRLSA